jgi:hypothetical protein
MNQSLRVLSIAVAALFAVGQIPARAQYATEFVPAKLIKEGKTSTTIAGSGKVVVQVQVNADGSHKVTKIISSTNSGDNAAATEIANSSTYRPARRGTTPITAFYDFTLRFSGRTVVAKLERELGCVAERCLADTGCKPGCGAHSRGPVRASKIQSADGAAQFPG